MITQKHLYHGNQQTLQNKSLTFESQLLWLKFCLDSYSELGKQDLFCEFLCHVNVGVFWSLYGRVAHFELGEAKLSIVCEELIPSHLLLLLSQKGNVGPPRNFLLINKGVICYSVLLLLVCDQINDAMFYVMEHCFYYQCYYFGLGNFKVKIKMTQQLNTCLELVKPWVQFPALHEKRKKKANQDKHHTQHSGISIALISVYFLEGRGGVNGSYSIVIDCSHFKESQ